jgi:RNA polymerase sigma factor (sigma-70 family)
MVLNQYLSWRRRFARVEPRALPPGPRHDEPDHATIHAERDALRAELDRLPRRQRAVLVLRFYAGMTDAEIAEELDCSAGTVRGYASRALATLRVSTESPTSDTVRRSDTVRPSGTARPSDPATKRSVR